MRNKFSKTDSALTKTAHGVALSGLKWAVGVAAVAVMLAPMPAGAQGGSAGQVQLDLAQVRLLQDNNELGKARALAARVVEANPNNAEAVAALASVEDAIGRHRRAAALFDRAAGLDSFSADVRAARANAARDNGGFIAVTPEAELRRDGDREYRLSANVEHPVNTSWRLFAGYDIVHANLRTVLLPNGVTSEFSGERQRAQAGAQYETEQGHTGRLAVFGNEGSVGGGGQFAFVGDDSKTNLSAEYHRANWDYSDLLANSGWRDQIAVGREQRFGGILEEAILGQLQFFVNRYGIDELHNVATSWGFNGSIEAPVGGPGLPISVAYDVEAEYVTHKGRITDTDGNVVPMVDINSREAHFLTVHYNYLIITPSNLPAGSQEQLELEVYAGGGYDRIGGRGGPVGGASLTWRGPRSLDAQLRADHVENVGRDSPTSTTVGGHLIWRY